MTDYRRDQYGGPVFDTPVDYLAALLGALAGDELGGTGGIELGGYDQRICRWLAGWDTATVATVVCWMRRIRAAAVHDALTQPGHSTEQLHTEITLTEEPPR